MIGTKRRPVWGAQIRFHLRIERRDDPRPSFAPHTHRSLSLQPPDEQPSAAVHIAARRIHKHELLGGLINEYKAAA